MLRAKVRGEDSISVTAYVGDGGETKQRWIDAEQLGECRVVGSDDYNNYFLSWDSPEGISQIVVADGADLDFLID